MTEVVQQWGAVLLASAVALPGMFVAALLLARRRAATGIEPRWALRSALCEIGMVAGTLPWLWMMFTPQPGPRLVHLVPGVDLAGQLGMGARFATVQIVGNLLPFASAGLLAPVRFRLPGVVRVVAGWAAVASGAVEVLQYVLDIGRVTSVDDVVVNTAGAALAALCSRHWWRGDGSPR